MTSRQKANSLPWQRHELEVVSSDMSWRFPEVHQPLVQLSVRDCLYRLQSQLPAMKNKATQPSSLSRSLLTNKATNYQSWWELPLSRLLHSHLSHLISTSVMNKSMQIHAHWKPVTTLLLEATSGIPLCYNMVVFQPCLFFGAELFPRSIPHSIIYWMLQRLIRCYCYSEVHYL